jgi:hypothetical protein
LTKEEKFPKEKFCYFGLRTNVRKIFVKRNLKKQKKSEKEKEKEKKKVFVCQSFWNLVQRT